jgi:hypothetical protein
MAKKSHLSQYQLNSDGSFSINDYNHAKAFSNFFPGVAGIWGIPMWVFYVNRGQGIASLGIESKDKAIVEFQPANKAYRLTSTQGFRTFLKVGKKFYEPFQNNAALTINAVQTMTVTSHDLTIEEINRTLGLKITVNYFTLPEESYAGLVRRVRIENISTKTLPIQMIDGLPALIPYGMKDWLCKNMSRTVEAWVKVTNVNKKAPYYQLNVEVADTPQVTHINEGNFYFAFDADAKGRDSLLTPVVDPVGVFGHATDFLVPEEFLKNEKFTAPQKQFTSNRTPSALSQAQFSLKPRQSREVVSLVGFAHDIGQLNRIVKQAAKRSFIDAKARRNKELIEEIKQMCLTVSSSTAFNHYCGQTFLDNVLRGGLPVSLKTAGGPVPFNVYSRKHGDLERDYNFFMLAPTYLSQGNGNFRDVNQNRRNDIWFNADVKDSAIINFFSLVQADGYNPLVVRGLMFSVADGKVAGQLVDRNIEGADRVKIKELLTKGFMPGELLNAIAKYELKLKGSAVGFLTDVLGHCQKQELSDHGEGFWSDHWTYNIDLLESYLAVYPEHLREVLVDKKVFSFFFNNHFVVPRDERYVLTKFGVRQYHSVVEKEDETHAKQKGFKLRINNGQGEVYRTTLAVKLLCLIANKAATLDPSGIGIEMEGDKPNWYDALNGLPGLLGSSISETFELKRYAQSLITALDQAGLSDQDHIAVFKELEGFIRDLTQALAESDPLRYWKRSNDIKEAYRQSVRLGIAGEEKNISVGDLKKFLNLVVAKTNQGVESARNGSDLFPTYFYHEVTEYERLSHRQGDLSCVRPYKFKRHDLPYFLEGFVHALRSTTTAQAQAIYQAIKKSKLYDKKLGMYKVNTDLSSESEEIGRTRIFPSGWLENESIWLHMEYKYFLELLRNGLAEEFYAEAKKAMIPFLDPNVYGRSILENSSFIASSAHEDERLHGQGFVARLSGSTAEFLHMWLIMNLGPRPFRLTAQKELTLHFEPVLPAEFFTKAATAIDHLDLQKKRETLTIPVDSYAFNMMGRTLVVYRNPLRLNTYGPNKAVVRSLALHYAGSKSPVDVRGAFLAGRHAQDVRSGKVARIDIQLG